MSFLAWHISPPKESTGIPLEPYARLALRSNVVMAYVSRVDDGTYRATVSYPMTPFNEPVPGNGYKTIELAQEAVESYFNHWLLSLDLTWLNPVHVFEE